VKLKKKVEPYKCRSKAKIKVTTHLQMKIWAITWFFKIYIGEAWITCKVIADILE
jgi:hypothetical protein